MRIIDKCRCPIQQLAFTASNRRLFVTGGAGYVAGSLDLATEQLVQYPDTRQTESGAFNVVAEVAWTPNAHLGWVILNAEKPSIKRFPTSGCNVDWLVYHSETARVIYFDLTAKTYH